MGGQNSSQRIEEPTKSNVWEIDYKKFQDRCNKAELKIKEIEEEIQREQMALDTLDEDKLRNHLCRTNGKKSLKEITDLVKEKRALHSLACEKSFIEKKLVITELKLTNQRELENLLLRQLSILEEEKHAEQQKESDQLTVTEDEQEADETALKSVENELVVVRGKIRSLEEEEKTFSKQMDAITKMFTISLEMPTEELTQKDKVLEADSTIFEKQSFEVQQRIRSLQKALKSEEEIHEHKLREITTEVNKSKKTLKEIGEIMKRETSNLERIFRKKRLEIGLEIGGMQLLHFREEMNLYLRKISLAEEVEVFHRENDCVGNEGDKSKVQKVLLIARELKEECESELSIARKEITLIEEQVVIMNQELDAINKLMDGKDEGT